MVIKLRRDRRPEPGHAFWAAAFGQKPLPNGEIFDHDAFYRNIIVPAGEKAGLTVVRADQVYGRGDLTDTAWYCIQAASLVLVDFSGHSTNVAAEFALALALGKRIVVLAQNPDDIPSDVRGHYRFIRYGSDWQSIERLRDELAKELPAALEQPATEMILVPMHSGGTTPVPGEVVITDREFVMVLTDDRRRVVLNAADVDPRRIIPDMGKRFPVGTRVNGWFEVDLSGDARYTLTPGQVNYWPALEANFPPGSVFRSRVDSVRPGVGVFVHVDHGVNGLVPEHRLAGREVAVGQDVEVAVTTFDAERRRIGLRLDRVLSVSAVRPPVDCVRSGTERRGDPARQPGPDRARVVQLPKVGARLTGTVTRAEKEKDGSGGFILLKVPGLQRPVLLHCTAMTEDLRSDLNEGFVEIGEEIPLEVLKVDSRTNKVSVKERPETDAAAAGEEPTAELLAVG